MKMFNSVVLQGRLTHTPELKKTTNGISVVSFDIAHDTYTNGEKGTDFFKCVAWRGNAEKVEKYFTKGQEIGIQGKLKTRTYTDRNGEKKTAYEVNVEEVHFIGSKNKNATQGEFEGNNKEYVEINEDDPTNGFVVVDEADDDLPF